MKVSRTLAKLARALQGDPEPGGLEVVPLIFPTIELGAMLSQSFQTNAVELNGVVAAGTDAALVTIARDGYYIVQASCGSMSNLGGLRDMLFHIANEGGGAVYEDRTILATTGGDGDHFGPMLFYLRRNWVVRLRINTAMVAGDVIETSVNVVRLYEE